MCREKARDWIVYVEGEQSPVDKQRQGKSNELQAVGTVKRRVLTTGSFARGEHMFAERISCRADYGRG